MANHLVSQVPIPGSAQKDFVEQLFEPSFDGSICLGQGSVPVLKSPITARFRPFHGQSQRCLFSAAAPNQKRTNPAWNQLRSLLSKSHAIRFRFFLAAIAVVCRYLGCGDLFGSIKTPNQLVQNAALRDLPLLLRFLG